MHSNALSGTALIVGFALLWLPLGQYGFLYENWMKLGTLMMPFLIFAAFSFGPAREWVDIKSPKVIALVLLSAYIIHQFEEHWIDIFGNVYAFQASVNEMISVITAVPYDPGSPLTSEAIFVINTSLVWLVGFLAIWTAPNRVFPALAMAGIVLANGAVHVLGALAFWSYNPGLLTSVVVFLPVSVLPYRWLKPSQLPLFASLIWAILAHVIMALGLMASTQWAQISPLSYYILLVLWSLLPGVLSNFGDLEDGVQH